MEYRDRELPSSRYDRDGRSGRENSGGYHSGRGNYRGGRGGGGDGRRFVKLPRNSNGGGAGRSQRGKKLK